MTVAELKFYWEVTIAQPTIQYSIIPPQHDWFSTIPLHVEYNFNYWMVRPLSKKKKKNHQTSSGILQSRDQTHLSHE